MNFILKNKDIIIGLLLISLKLFYLDVDPPKWHIGYYQPIDETYYVGVAYDLYEYGNAFHQDKVMVFGVPVLTNIVTYISLNVFGDTYFGLRFSSFLLALTSIVLLALILRKIVKNETIRLFAIIFFGLNFTFSLASIFVEPTIARISSLLIVIYLILSSFQSLLKNPKNIVLVNGVVVFVLLITYPTNAFTLLATYVIFVVYPLFVNENNNKKIDFLQRNIYYLVSIVAVVSIFYFIFYLEGINLLNQVFSRGGDYKGRVGFGIKSVIENILNIGKANIFIYNPLLMVLWIIALLSIIVKTIKKQSHVIFILLCFTISFLLQTIFINDFPQRKLVILLPLIILSLAIYCDEIIGLKLKVNRKAILSFTFSILSLIVVFVVLNNLKKSIGSITLLLSGLFISWMIYKKNSINLRSISVVWVLLIISELAFSLKYIYLKPTYYYKDALQALSKYDNNNFNGGFSLGFRTYNKINPTINVYLYYNNVKEYESKILERSKNTVKSYLIGYDDEIEKYNKLGFSVKDTILDYKKTVDFKKKSVILFEKVNLK